MFSTEKELVQAFPCAIKCQHLKGMDSITSLGNKTVQQLEEMDSISTIGNTNVQH